MTRATKQTTPAGEPQPADAPAIRRHRRKEEDEPELIDLGVDEFFEGDLDSSPSDRRRDPLRQ